jgi:quercetin dioxygenase-like cupin family protein
MVKKLEAESFGRKLRNLREKLGLSLEELARQLSLKPGYLKKLEDDEVLPPVGEIITIARHLSVEPSTFMQSQAEKPTAEKRRHALAQRTRDYAYQLLTRGTEDDHLMAFLVTIDPESYHRRVAYQHSGEEFIYVLSGNLKITVDKKNSFLKTGQSIHFDSGKRHFLKNPGKAPARLLVVVYHP